MRVRELLVVGLLSSCQSANDGVGSVQRAIVLPELERVSVEEARALVEARLEVGERVDDLVVRALPYSGKALIEASVNSGTNARLLSLSADGTVVDHAEQVTDELLAQRELIGKLSPTLHNHIAALDGAEMVRVAIRHPSHVVPMELPEDTGAGLRGGQERGSGGRTGGGSGASSDERAAQLLEWVRRGRLQIADELGAEHEPLIRWLELVGAVDIQGSQNAASVVADVRVDFLLDHRIHDRSDVIWIDFAEDPILDELAGYAAHEAMDESFLDPGSGGMANYCTGACTSYPLVGIWESGLGQLPGRIANYNGRFWSSTNATYFATPTTCSNDSDCYSGQRQTICQSGTCVAAHTSNVAASLGMNGSYGQDGSTFPHAGTFQTQFRIANDSSLAGFQWLLSQSVLHANRSEGMALAPTNQTVYEVDLAARQSFLFMTQSSGNDGSTSGHQNTCPAYNTLCVGAYLYGNYDIQTDDVLASFSSYGNRADPGGVERPHVLGPDRAGGTYLPKVDVSPGSTEMTRFSTVGSGSVNSGTSFASPAVLSIANQMHVYEGYFSYLAYPIVKKAILMTGALDANNDGPILAGTSWKSTPDGQDGAGGPNVRHIKRILDGNTYSWKALKSSSFSSCGTNCLQAFIGTVSVPSTHAVRATLVYNSCPLEVQSGIFTNAPANDLDLWLVDPNIFWGTSASSTSIGNEVDALYYHSGFAGHTFNIYVRLKAGATLNLCGSEISEPVAVAWDAYYVGGGIQL